MVKRFTHRNESFNCANCNANVPPLKGSCRNHCTQCLTSRHVDISPGDRSSNCRGLMQPVQVIMKGDCQIVLHRCVVCGHLQKNRVATDDSLEMILEIIKTNPLVSGI